MKIRHWILLITLIGASTWLIILTGDIAPRVDKNIDLNWRFIQDDQSEFSNINYNDAHWKILTLPHEWRAEASSAWYRKEFDLSAHDSKKQFFLHFDCLNNINEIWLNGRRIGGKTDSLYNLNINVTDHVRTDSINVLALRSSTQKQNALNSGGIFGHVEVIATELLHFPIHSAIVNTTIQENKNQISTTFTLTNNEKRSKRFKIRSDLLAPDGHLIRSIVTSRSIEANTSINIVEEFQIEDARTWSPENPKQYELRSFLIHKKKVTDHLITPFAFKDISFTPDSGLYINKKQTAIRAINMQHGEGIINYAIADASWEYKLNILKKLGFNALSFPEYNISSNLSNLCEKMGFLLLNEDIEIHNLATHELADETNIISSNADVKPYTYYTQSFQEKPVLKLSVLDSQNEFKTILRSSQWTDADLLRHWNFNVKEKKEVIIFTNCEKIYLQLNKQKPLELIKSNFKDGVIHASIPFIDGKLYVKAVKPDNSIISDSLVTAGPAKIIHMQTEKKSLIADGRDLVHIKTTITDSTGVKDPNGNQLIKYTLEGAGKIKYAENDTFAKRVQKGSHMLIVQAGIEPGDLTIKARADGLKPVKLKIKSVEPTN